MNTTTHSTTTKAAFQSTEIVSVAFKADIPFEQQKSAMQSLADTISGFAGFIDRQFYYSEGLNRWTDIVTWSDIEKAQAASKAMMSKPCAEEVFPLMVEESMIMGHFEQVA